MRGEVRMFEEQRMNVYTGRFCLGMRIKVKKVSGMMSRGSNTYFRVCHA